MKDFFISVTILFSLFLALYYPAGRWLGLKFRVWGMMIVFSYSLTLLFPAILSWGFEIYIVVTAVILICLLGALAIQKFNYINSSKERGLVKAGLFFKNAGQEISNHAQGVKLDWLERGIMYKANGRLDKAIDAFYKAMEERGQDDLESRALIQIELSSIYMQQGKVEKAADLLFNVLQSQEELNSELKSRVQLLLVSLNR